MSTAFDATRSSLGREVDLLDEELAWTMLLALARRASLGTPIVEPCGLSIGTDGSVAVVPRGVGQLQLDPSATPTFKTVGRVAQSALLMLDLYLPLCLGARSATLVVGHLGQSLDGQIATSTGASRYVSGRDDLIHTHRLRALCDAVLVGATTAALDDPQLTTRLVPGPNPVRVVIDPQWRVAEDRRLFSDGVAPTIVVGSGPSDSPAFSRTSFAHVERVEIASKGGKLAPTNIVGALAEKGVHRLLVEGGGVTLSHFLAAGALDRLHLTVCPVLMGKGRSGVTLPPVDQLHEVKRPRTRRFLLGDDVLFDCDMARSNGTAHDDLRSG